MTLVLTPEGASYRVVTKIRITRPPIRVLATSSHGWHDIGVWVQGGGIQRGYEAKLQFDGKTYPSNPSSPPALPVAGKVGSEREFDGGPFLGSFLEPLNGDEFDVGYGHPLGLE